MDNSNDFAVGYAVGDNAANRNCYGNGMFGADGGFFWIFALLLLPMMNNGGFWGNNGRGQAVTEAGLCNAMNFNNLENAVGRQSDQIANMYTGLQNGICNFGYETLRNFNNLEAQLASCCCGIEKLLLENKYQAAQNTAEINANVTAQIQSVKDMLCQQEAARKDARIWQLELNQAFCGVPRFQPGTVYGSIPVNPFFGNWNNCGGCCGNGNI